MCEVGRGRGWTDGPRDGIDGGGRGKNKMGLYVSMYGYAGNDGSRRLRSRAKAEVKVKGCGIKRKRNGMEWK